HPPRRRPGSQSSGRMLSRRRHHPFGTLAGGRRGCPSWPPAFLRVTPAASAVCLLALPGDRGASLEEGSGTFGAQGRRTAPSGRIVKRLKREIGRCAGGRQRDRSCPCPSLLRGTIHPR